MPPGFGKVIMHKPDIGGSCPSPERSYSSVRNRKIADSKRAFRNIDMDEVSAIQRRYMITGTSISCDGLLVRITPLQARLLAAIASTPRVAVSRENVIRLTWDVSALPGDPEGVVKVVLSHLRTRMKRAGMPSPVGTVWNYGYLFVGQATVMNSVSFMLNPSIFSDLCRLLETHPNRVLADRVANAVV